MYMLQQREEHPAANLVMCLDQTPSCLSDRLICSTEVSLPAVCLQRVPERFHILKLPGNFRIFRDFTEQLKEILNLPDLTQLSCL